MSIRSWIISWLETGRINSICKDGYSRGQLTPTPSSNSSIDSDRGINFMVYKATGGTVIETRSYDQRTDRSIRGLYVIKDGDNIGDEIGKIITMEALKL